MKCCDFRPGMLRNQVTIETPSRTADGQGGFAVSWSTVATVPAHIKQASGGETVTAMRIEGRKILDCVMRYRTDVSGAERIMFDGQPWNIRDVEDIEYRGRYLRLTLESGAT